ncbi:MAG: hypothetical protein KH046_00605 [Stenotrophomonas maltophilia]|uniref:hypothetical protein n=1 Tax=Stenotrophomonas maltophilia TaxID=40324 RepID=UPI0013DB0F6D|nr:hypothetical protein [Stenotrophomonas maltophilia]MBS4799320.1 hypothetical protein [Stenotrophomonas maltophilia]
MADPYRAMKKHRGGRAAELSVSRFLDGVNYLQAAEREMAMPDLFAVLDDGLKEAA